MNRPFALLLLGIPTLFVLGACVPIQKAKTPLAKPFSSTNTAPPLSQGTKLGAAMEAKIPESEVPTPNSPGEYKPYSESAFSESFGKKRVLFFHANWCPECRAADKVLNANLSRIPADVVLFKTDYDTEKALKAKYGVTYQHTYVHVDANGAKLKIWNGGDIDELIANTK